MNSKDYYEHAVQSLAGTDDESRPAVLEKLAEQYMAEAALHTDETTALLVAESLKYEALLAEAALGKYDKHTKPGFFLPLAGVTTLIAIAIIQAAPFGGKQAWILALVLLMLYVCLRLLPKWRKLLPELQDGVKELAANAIDAAGSNPQPHWQAAVENRRRIVDVLSEAMYRNPFQYWSEQLLMLAVGNAPKGE